MNEAIEQDLECVEDPNVMNEAIEQDLESDEDPNVMKEAMEQDLECDEELRLDWNSFIQSAHACMT